MARRDRSPAAVARAFVTSDPPIVDMEDAVAALVRAVRRECARVADDTEAVTARATARAIHDRILALNYTPQREVRRGR